MDKRIARRYMKQISVRFGERAGEHIGTTYDVSEKGVLLRSSRIYPPLTQLSIEFLFPDKKTVYCQGGVQWARRVPPALARVIQKHGMGISLTGISPEYHQFIKKLDASFAVNK